MLAQTHPGLPRAIDIVTQARSTKPRMKPLHTGFTRWRFAAIAVLSVPAYVTGVSPPALPRRIAPPSVAWWHLVGAIAGSNSAHVSLTVPSPRRDQLSRKN